MKIFEFEKTRHTLPLILDGNVAGQTTLTLDKRIKTILGPVRLRCRGSLCLFWKSCQQILENVIGKLIEIILFEFHNIWLKIAPQFRFNSFQIDKGGVGQLFKPKLLTERTDYL